MYRAALVGAAWSGCGAYATVPAFTLRWLGTGNKGMFPNRRFCYRLSASATESLSCDGWNRLSFHGSDKLPRKSAFLSSNVDK